MMHVASTCIVSVHTKRDGRMGDAFNDDRPNASPCTQCFHNFATPWATHPTQVRLPGCPRPRVECLTPAGPSSASSESSIALPPDSARSRAARVAGASRGDSTAAGVVPWACWNACAVACFVSPAWNDHRTNTSDSMRHAEQRMMPLKSPKCFDIGRTHNPPACGREERNISLCPRNTLAKLCRTVANTDATPKMGPNTDRASFCGRHDVSRDQYWADINDMYASLQHQSKGNLVSGDTHKHRCGGHSRPNGVPKQVQHPHGGELDGVEATKRAKRRDEQATSAQQRADHECAIGSVIDKQPPVEREEAYSRQRDQADGRREH